MARKPVAQTKRPSRPARNEAVAPRSTTGVRITRLSPAGLPGRRYKLARFGTLVVTEGGLDTFAAVSLGPNTGSLAATEAADTFAASGTIPLFGSGALAVTEAADTLAATGSVLVSGDLITTEAADTLFATSSLGSTGSLATTEAPDILAALQGRGKFTQLKPSFLPGRRFTSFSPRQVQSSATFAVVESPDTIVSSGMTAVFGPLAVTEVQDTAVGDGFIPAPTIGTMAALEPQALMGLYDQNGNPILDGNGDWVSIPVCNDSVTGFGLVGPANLGTGTMAATESPDLFAGILDIPGTFAATEAQDTAAFTGTATTFASLAATEAQDIAAFSSTSVTSGSMAATESSADTFAAASVAQFLAQLAATDTPDTAAATGKVFITGTMACTEPMEDIFVTGMLGTVLVSGVMNAFERADYMAFGTGIGQYRDARRR